MLGPVSGSVLTLNNSVVAISASTPTGVIGSTITGNVSLAQAATSRSFTVGDSYEGARSGGNGHGFDHGSSGGLSNARGHHQPRRRLYEVPYRDARRAEATASTHRRRRHLVGDADHPPHHHPPPRDGLHLGPDHHDLCSTEPVALAGRRSPRPLTNGNNVTAVNLLNGGGGAVRAPHRPWSCSSAAAAARAVATAIAGTSRPQWLAPVLSGQVASRSPWPPEARAGYNIEQLRRSHRVRAARSRRPRPSRRCSAPASPPARWSRSTCRAGSATPGGSTVTIALLANAGQIVGLNLNSQGAGYTSRRQPSTFVPVLPVTSPPQR